MKWSALFALAVTTVFGSTGFSDDKPDGWNPDTKLFTSVDGQFRIKFSSAPVVSGKTLTWRENDNTFSVEYFDLDEKKRKETPVEKLLDEIGKTQMQTWGEDKSPKSIKLGDHPGRELFMWHKSILFTSKYIVWDRGAMVKYYLVNSRVYILRASETEIQGQFHDSIYKPWVLLTTSFELIK